MVGAHNRLNREVRAVKMRSTIKDEVRYVQELHYMKEMRKNFVHQLPQVFAATEPHVVSDVKPAIGDVKPAIGDMKPAMKVEPTDSGKKEPEPVSEHISGPNEPELARVAPEVKNKTVQFLILLATYLLGLGTFYLGIVILWDPSIFKESGLATEIVALVIGRVYTGTGLAMLILAYQKHLRALSTLFLCEAVAETVMMVLASNSGFGIDFLIGVPMTVGKFGLSWCIIIHREREIRNMRRVRAA